MKYLDNLLFISNEFFRFDLYHANATIHRFGFISYGRACYGDVTRCVAPNDLIDKVTVEVFLPNLVYIANSSEHMIPKCGIYDSVDATKKRILKIANLLKTQFEIDFELSFTDNPKINLKFAGSSYKENIPLSFTIIGKRWYPAKLFFVLTLLRHAYMFTAQAFFRLCEKLESEMNIDFINLLLLTDTLDTYTPGDAKIFGFGQRYSILTKDTIRYVCSDFALLRKIITSQIETDICRGYEQIYSMPKITPMRWGIENDELVCQDFDKKTTETIINIIKTNYHE